MENIGNFIHFYIARFEVSLKCYIKMPSIKNIVTQTVKVCKCLKYKKQKHLILDIYIFIYLKKTFNFVVDFTSMFSCFRIAG